MSFSNICGLKCKRGKTFPYGSTVLPDGGINFSVNSHHAESCFLQLYSSGETKPFADIRIPDSYRTGANFSITVYGLDFEKLEYTYRFKGSVNTIENLRSDENTEVLDPYSKLVSGREVWGGARGKNVPFRSKVLFQDYDWEDDHVLETPIEDLVIYEMHVRGISMDSPEVKSRGTYAGVIEKIPYFKDLGVNCLELLPVFEFNELEYVGNIKDRDMFNYWGYSTVSFFAPKAAYSSDKSYAGAVREFKDMVKALHKNGIEVILDVVFNHTAEMGKGGPVLNYRAIDDSIYYMKDENGGYPNYSGCGNTFNCNHPVVREHILDSLRYWVTDFHVDGFRFDEAPVLTRDSKGKPMENPPLIEAITEDPVLSKTKVITETWDAAGLVLIGRFPGGPRWAEWNEIYRNSLRAFVRGDEGSAHRIISAIKGSPEYYNGENAHSTVNFVTCHDGFTLNDLVSYNQKHNRENGEENRDGTDNNISWNCGVEGETDDRFVEDLRNRQVKNAFALLMLSRGVPMMKAGDEIRNSQKGNNNVYCQDGPLSWINWENRSLYPDVYDFFKAMIHLRLQTPALRKKDSHLTFFSADGAELHVNDHTRVLSFMYGSKKDEEVVFCAANTSNEECRITVPEGFLWSVVADSAQALEEGSEITSHFDLGPRSVAVLKGRS